MLEISMQAALMIVMICFFMGFLSMLIFMRSIKVYGTRIYFLTFYLISVLGTLLIYIRDDISSAFISVILANLLLIAGYAILCLGTLKLIERKPNITYIVVVMVAFLLFMLYFTYLKPDVVIRVVIYNSSAILLLGKLIIDLQHNKKPIHLFDELMTPVLILLLMILIFRVIGIFVFQETTSDFLQFQRDSLVVALSGIVNLLVIAGLFSLINNKVNADLFESERSKSSLLSSLPGFAYRCLVDEYWTMLFLSEGFTSLTGYQVDEVIGNKSISFEDLIKPEYREQLREGWAYALEHHEKYHCEYRITTKEGKSLWVWEQGIGIYDNSGNVVAIEGYISDIDDRKKMEQNLEYQSYRDYLTGLYNRRYIENEIATLQESGRFPISMIVIDVNDLKHVNDTYGHEQGDEIIKGVADILRNTVMFSSLIARLGGDEFLVVLDDVSKVACDEVVAMIWKESKKQKYQKLSLSFAIGCETKNNSNTTLNEVLRIAENNMYLQKQKMKSSVQ